MAKIKYFIRSSNKKTSANIRIRIYQGKVFDITASIQRNIIPKYWNNTKGEVRQRIEFKEAGELQKTLDDLRSFVQKAINSTPDKNKITSEWLKSNIDKFYFPEKYLTEKTLFGFIEHFIKNSDTRLNPKTGNPVSYKMKREYITTFRYLKEYAAKYKEPDFIDMDLEFHQNFVTFLREKGLALNTQGKKIQTLKIFLNDAYEKGINPYTKFKSKKFKTLSEESDNIYLTEKEINQLYNYNLSDKPTLERVRDVFIIGCWTGLRYGDLKQITKDRIKNNLIEIRQKKTGNKIYVPIHPTVKLIFNKYKWKLPKPISNQKFNDYLKEAAKLAGIDEPFHKTISYYGKKITKKYFKHQLISSHTARRSFCTNAYKKNMPTITIMAISGHKTEAAFLKYIKLTPEEHAKKMMEFWKEETNHLKVV